VTGTSVVSVADGKLTLTNGSGASNNKINFIDISPTTATPVANQDPAPTSAPPSPTANPTNPPATPTPAPATPTAAPTSQPTTAPTSNPVVGAVQVNFQPANAQAPGGFLVDSGAVYGNRGNGFTYGWNAGNEGSTRDRDSTKSRSQEYDTFIHTQEGAANTWEIELPNGNYRVRVAAGDPKYVDSVFKLAVEGVTVVDGVPVKGSPWVEGEVVVTVSDGRLTLTNASGAVNNKVNFIVIESQ
jgi:hypothetical protein